MFAIVQLSHPLHKFCTCLTLKQLVQQKFFWNHNSYEFKISLLNFGLNNFVYSIWTKIDLQQFLKTSLIVLENGAQGLEICLTGWDSGKTVLKKLNKSLFC